MLNDLKPAMDYALGCVGLAISLLFNHLNTATALCALVLIIVRIVIGYQEFRLNQRKLDK